MDSKKTIIRKALQGNGVLPCVSGSLRILSGDCVNSKWRAAWLAKGDNGCQCGFKCKVRVEISRNGHNPYQYVVDKSELYRLMKQ